VKHAIIICHPNVHSFTASSANSYADACRALGHDVIVRDLYRIGFDPCLKPAELPFAAPVQVGADVALERKLLADCDVFALFYPLWLNAPPAMLKGYLERVFGFGFAYGGGGHSYNPLLSGRKLVSFSSSGAPLMWLKKTGALGALHTLFDGYFSQLCGMTPLEHVHTGGVTPAASQVFVDARLKEVRNTVSRHFGSEICH